MGFASLNPSYEDCKNSSTRVGVVASVCSATGASQYSARGKLVGWVSPEGH
jgi:hypothetical protein